jgi:hypothetical protein
MAHGRRSRTDPIDDHPPLVDFEDLESGPDGHAWSRVNTVCHIVRRNHIPRCGRNGIHGSLGGIFCTIEGNTIHDIATRGWHAGADMAGLRLLGSIDVIISDNHIHHCGRTGGHWLDRMAQGPAVLSECVLSEDGQASRFAKPPARGGRRVAAGRRRSSVSRW